MSSQLFSTPSFQQPSGPVVILHQISDLIAVEITSFGTRSNKCIELVINGIVHIKIHFS